MYFDLSRRSVLFGLAMSAFSMQAPPAFDPATAKKIEDLCEEIIPGAREARVIEFIQRALATVFKDQKSVYEQALASLPPGGVKAIEKTPFFEVLRTHTIMGFLANPSWGGNKDEIGWKSIGFVDGHMFESPFGFYDDPKNAGKI